MNDGKYVFAQITNFLPKRVFDGIVDHLLPENKYASFSENSDVALSENSDV